MLRRLGSPRHRFVCPRCRQYVGELVMVWDWSKLQPNEAPTPANAITVCEPCGVKVQENNEAHTKRQVADEMAYQRANIDYRYYSARPSNRAYRLACEQMRRELRQEGWGGIFD